MSKYMKISISLVLCFLFIGCEPIPNEVRANDSKNIRVPVKELHKENGELNVRVNDAYLIDGVVSIENLSHINEYEISSMRYSEEEIRIIINNNETWDIVEGKLLEGNELLIEDDYLPFIAECEDYSIYVNEKRGILTYALNDDSYFNALNSDTLVANSSSIEGTKVAREVADDIIKRFKCQLVFKSSKAYQIQGSDYFVLDYSQAVDGVKIVQEVTATSNQNTPYLPEVQIVIRDGKLVFLSAVLVEPVKSLESYEEVLSMASAIKVIDDSRKLLFNTGRKYMRKDGEVSESGVIVAKKISIAYLPTKMDSSFSRNKLIPIWFFESGENRQTDVFLNIKINAINGDIL